MLARNALGGAQDDAAVKALLRENGWGGAWTWQVFDYHHFHPDAFEVLAVARGSATLMLGGPQGEEIDVEAGDVMILPPGFGH
ncbi:MAG: cupin domain-containing protein, partial [Rhizobiaceae bacterium]